MNILIVDDEKEIADLLQLYLEGGDFHTFCCGSVGEARAVLGRESIDLALLDVMLPDGDGFSFCREIRERHTFPILMLTAKVEDRDKISGFAFGADDYITKPFNPLEVVARVKAQLRRYRSYGAAPEKEATLFIGALSISKQSHTCTHNGKALSLTPIEFDILWTLCQNRGSVVSSEELFEQVWGEKYLERNNTVMVHIRRLREKLGEPPRNPKIIKTVWGVGYKIDER